MNISTVREYNTDMLTIEIIADAFDITLGDYRLLKEYLIDHKGTVIAHFSICGEELEYIGSITESFKPSVVQSTCDAQDETSSD